ncbi:MAG: Protein UmuD [Chlamydiia bacterium]|nr:Protein UmuD [Chlamydiia bacterium]
MSEPCKLSFYKAHTDVKTEIPIFSQKVQAGFPSPAEDHVDRKLDLNELLIKNKAATFFVKVEGMSMENAHIFHDDILVVDRSLTAKSGQIIVAVLENEFTVKRILFKEGLHYLVPENPQFPLIKVDDYPDFQIWGVVTYIIHNANK